MSTRLIPRITKHTAIKIRVPWTQAIAPPPLLFSARHNYAVAVAQALTDPAVAGYKPVDIVAAEEADYTSEDMAPANKPAAAAEVADCRPVNRADVASVYFECIAVVAVVAGILRGVVVAWVVLLRSIRYWHLRGIGCPSVCLLLLASRGWLRLRVRGLWWCWCWCWIGRLGRARRGRRGGRGRRRRCELLAKL